MPLPLKTDSLDAIPEALRSAYVEREGAFHLDAEIEDVTPLKSALDKERKRASDAEKAKKEADRVRAELEAKIKGAEAGLTEDQQKQYRESIRAELEKEYEPLKAIEGEYTALKRITLLDNPVKSLMLTEKVGVRAERQEALWKQIGDRFDLTSDGKPMVTEHIGLSVEEYLAVHIKKEFPEWYRGTQAAGGGAGGGTGGGGSVTDKRPPTQWSADERRAYIEEHGADAYRKLLNAQIRDGVKAKAS